MSSVTTDQIVERVAQIVRETLPEAVVYGRALVGFEEGRCPDELRNPDGIVHGWIVTDIGEAREWAEETVSMWRDVVRLKIYGFYQFDPGTDADNSERRWRAIRQRLRDAITARSDLGIDSVDGHSELQVLNTAVYLYAAQLIHRSDCEIAIAVLNSQEY